MSTDKQRLIDLFDDLGLDELSEDNFYGENVIVLEAGTHHKIKGDDNSAVVFSFDGDDQLLNVSAWQESAPE